MSHGKRPKGKHTLTIHFDTKTGIKNFMAWYLDAGGEQSSKYYSESWGKDWMYVQTSETACPKCEYDDKDLLEDIWEDDDNPEFLKTHCDNCTHIYKVKNPYYTP
jgi:hypothetical protein